MNKKQKDFLIKLKRKKYREEHKKFIIENFKIVLEEYSNQLLDSIYVTEKFYKENEDEMVFKNIDIISEKDLKKVSHKVNPPGIIALFNIPREKKFNFQKRLILLLDDIQDPGNLGTIIRTADWFGFTEIFCSTNCVEVYNPKVTSSTMGSIFNLNIHSNVNLKDLIKELKKERYKIVVTDLNGRNIKFNKKDKIALVIGSEAKGVSSRIKNLADLNYKIEKSGKAESLNVAIATGIIMKEIKF